MPNTATERISRLSLESHGPFSQSDYVSLRDIQSQQPGILTHVGSSFPHSDDQFLNQIEDPYAGADQGGAAAQLPTIQIEGNYTHVYPHRQSQEPDFLDHSSQGTNASYPDRSYLTSNNGIIGGSSVRSSVTWDYDEPDDTVPSAAESGQGEHVSRPELPDFFYAHKPIRYQNFKNDCTRAYSDFHGFVRNSLKKHRSRGHMEHEGISDEQYYLALQIKNPTAGRSMTLADKHRKHWKLVRRVLFGTSIDVPIPECENMGKHDIYKAKRTDREKKHRTGRSISTRTSSCGTSPARSNIPHSNIDFQHAGRAAPELLHSNSLLPPNPLVQSRAQIFRPRQQLLHIGNRSFPPAEHGLPSVNSAHTQSVSSVDRACIRQTIDSTFRSLLHMESRFSQDSSSHSEHTCKFRDMVNQITALVEDFRNNITGARTSSSISMFAQQPSQHFSTTAHVPSTNTAYPATQGMRHASFSTFNHTRQSPETMRDTNRGRGLYPNHYMHNFG